MITAGSSGQMTIAQLAERFQVSQHTVRKWTAEEEFPSPVRGRTSVKRFEVDEVDAWVMRHRAAHWIKFKGGSAFKKGKSSLNPPEGDDDDLLPLRRIGVIEGRLLGRDPIKVETLRSYMSKGILSKPDRVPGDGLVPQVEEAMWTRRSVNQYLQRPRQRVRRPKSAPQPSQDTKARERPLLDLVLPEGDPTTLLTLKDIGELDFQVRRYGKGPLKESSLVNYLSQGLLAKADRTPGDGGIPSVTEDSWYLSTVDRFVRRPGRVGKNARWRTNPN